MIQDCDPLVTVTREFGAFRLSALEGGGACTCRAVGSNSGLLASSVGAPSVVTRLRCDSSSRASSSSVATQALSQDALPALMPEDVGSGLSPTGLTIAHTSPPHTRMAGRDSSRSRRTARRLKARLPMLLRSPLGDRDVVAAHSEVFSHRGVCMRPIYMYCDFLFPSCVCVSPWCGATLSGVTPLSRRVRLWAVPGHRVSACPVRTRGHRSARVRLHGPRARDLRHTSDSPRHITHGQPFQCDFWIFITLPLP